MKESRIAFLARIFLADVLAEIPIELNQRGIDGDRRLDLRGTVAAFKIGYPSGVRLPVAISLYRVAMRPFISSFTI